MNYIYNVLYVSMLCKYVGDPTNVLGIDEIELSKSMMYEDWPIQILYKKLIITIRFDW